MPPEDSWAGFFDAAGVVAALDCPAGPEDTVVELGSGYGTFTFPVARRTVGPVWALEIEPDLVERLRLRAASAGLGNISATHRDFVENGAGLPDSSADHVMAYNILHLEDPVSLLREARRVLRPGGACSVIHWRSKTVTPRGPPLEIRPTPKQCREWARLAGFSEIRGRDLRSSAPWHYGLLLLT